MMKVIGFLAAAVILSGCAASEKTKKEENADPEAEDLRKYESQFTPSDYDREISTLLKEEKEKLPGQLPDTREPAPPEKLELVPGFRVQIFSTTNIDEANRRKAEAEQANPDVRFYIAYNPPTYKVRAGNFLTRFEADQFARELSERGFRDAWTVPEKVYKIPPAKNP